MCKIKLIFHDIHRYTIVDQSFGYLEDRKFESKSKADGLQLRDATHCAMGWNNECSN